MKMLASFIIALMLSITAHASTIGDQFSAMALTDMVARFAPYFVVDRHREGSSELCPYNIPTLVNFDTNWNVTDNDTSYLMTINENPDVLANPSNYRDQGIANTYYEIVTSKTHAFIVYYLFYPHDGGYNCMFDPGNLDGGHLNDASSVTAIVRLDNAGGTLEWFITQDHKQVLTYQPDDLLLKKNHPYVKIFGGYHTMEPMDPAGETPSHDTHYLFGDGDIYRLHSIYHTLWQKRADKQVYCTDIMNIGLQYCGKPNDANSQEKAPWAPWARDFTPGESERSPIFMALPASIPIPSFIDPIGAFRSLYPDTDENGYSMEYVNDPYLKDLFPSQTL